MEMPKVTPNPEGFVLGYLAGATELDMTGVTVTLVDGGHDTDMVTVLNLVVTLPEGTDAEDVEYFNDALDKFATWNTGPEFVDDTGKVWVLGDGDDGMAVEKTETGWTIWFRYFK
jgi:hypothetical protein